MPYFRRWKLQPDKVPTPQEQWACTLQVLFAHFTVELPLVCEVTDVVAVVEPNLPKIYGFFFSM